MATSTDVERARTALWKISKNAGDPRWLAAIAWLAAYDARDAVALALAEARLRAAVA